jgi:hypothetical protein
LNTVSLWFVLARGLFCVLLGFFGIIAMNMRTTDFLRNSYWKWFAGTLGCALLGPIIYMWMQDFQISFMDAATLKVLRAGAWNVARGYGLFGGVVFGGIAVRIAARLRESRP